MQRRCKPGREDALRSVSLLVSATLSRVRDMERAGQQLLNANAVNFTLRKLEQATSQEDALAAALAAVAQSFGWSYGSYWERSCQDDTLRFSVDTGAVSVEFREASQRASFAEGVGLSGRAWKARDLVITADLSALTDCPRVEPARRAGVRSGVAFPVIVRAQVVGVMDFFALEVIELSEERCAALRSVAGVISLAIDRFAGHRIAALVEAATASIMYADRDLRLRYINPAARKVLKTLQPYISMPVDSLLGQSIDIFHKNPAHQHRMLAQPEKLPHTTDSITELAKGAEETATGASNSQKAAEGLSRLARNLLLTKRTPTCVMKSHPTALQNLCSTAATWRCRGSHRR